MTKYAVYAITRLSKFVGEFEAESENEAINQAVEGKLYQSIGGPCYHCSKELGDEEDREFVAISEGP